jgi:hypothetical protein
MSGIKKAIPYAIIPALIAGIFSIAPKLYDIATEPNTRLTYTLTRGPELELQGQYRRITSVKVQNAGKKALHNVQAETNLPSGSFESFRVQESSGLHPNVKESKNAISVEVDTFHPNEDFTIVTMELVPNSNTVEHFLLRSKEVLGEQAFESREKKKPSDIIGAILSGVSVFVMAVLILVKRHSLSGPEREDNIYYSIMRIGLADLSQEIRFLKGPLTYMRTADILLEQGLQGDDATREKCLKVLKCFLLIGNMTSSSRKIVEENIKILAGKSFSAEELASIKNHGTSLFGSSNVRQKIDQFISDPEAFFANKT